MLFIQCAEVQIERHEQTRWKKGSNIMQPILETFGVTDKRKNAKMSDRKMRRPVRLHNSLRVCVWGFIIFTICHNTNNNNNNNNNNNPDCL
jgi:hypothetical protein